MPYATNFERNPDALAALLGGLGHALCAIRADGIVQTWDATAASLTGRRAEEVEGRPAALLETADGCIERALAAIHADRRDLIEIDAHLRTRSGRDLHVVGVASAIHTDDGDTAGVLMAFRPLDPIQPPASEQAVPDVDGLVGRSEAMQEVKRRLLLAANSDVTTLLLGESGTGKEVAARTIHDQSDRRERPFVAVNCAALPESMLEAELFGHVRGAFTGATRDRAGLIEAADGGTLFLDEIGDLSPAMQVKLLRVLQEREVRRIGDDQIRKVDVRLVTATNRDLRQLLANGAVREDFYYRIRVYEISMPPLRERMADVPLLVDWFVLQLNQCGRRELRGATQDTIRLMLDYAWPGNVRELHNAVEHAFVTADGAWIQPTDLPDEVRSARASGNDGDQPGQHTTVLSQRDLDERARILAELDRNDWNRTVTANALGYSRVTLWKKMRKFAIDEGVFRRGR